MRGRLMLLEPRGELEKLWRCCGQTAPVSPGLTILAEPPLL